MFETVANKMLGITGPGMFGSITIASVLLPHQEAFYQLELATGHWEQASKKHLRDFQADLVENRLVTILVREIARDAEGFY